MKTLQQEIVEALRKASGTARKYAKQYDEFALSYHEYMDQSIEFENIASKVESARCENCEHWAKEGSFQLRLCAIHDEDRQFQDFCWNFKRKVESK